MHSLIDTLWNFTFLEPLYVGKHYTKRALKRAANQALYVCENDQLDAHFFPINLFQLYCPLHVSN